LHAKIGCIGEDAIILRKEPFTRLNLFHIDTGAKTMKRLIVMVLCVAGLLALGGAQLGAQPAGKAQEATKRAAQDYLKHGLILATEGRPEAAVKSFEKAINLDPTSAEAYSLLGSALAKAGKYREAEENLRKAIKLDPNYGEGYYYLGIFLQEHGKQQEAEEAFRKAQQCSR